MATSTTTTKDRILTAARNRGFGFTVIDGRYVIEKSIGTGRTRRQWLVNLAFTETGSVKNGWAQHTADNGWCYTTAIEGAHQESQVLSYLETAR